VTGSVAFARFFIFRQNQREWRPPVLTISAARILRHPEKPGPLDADELSCGIRLLGYQTLQSVAGLAPEMLDMVVHHHEFWTDQATRIA
jgi:hypothetical protein